MGEYEQQLLRRAAQLCRAAEPHGVGRNEPGCKKHLREARLQLVVEEAYAKDDDRVTNGG